MPIIKPVYREVKKVENCGPDRFSAPCPDHPTSDLRLSWARARPESTGGNSLKNTLFTVRTLNFVPQNTFGFLLLFV